VDLSSADELVKAAKKFLKDRWDEDTISMTIIKNEVVDGNGRLHTDCVVKLGGSTSKWHKIFTFEQGKVVDEEYHLL
jgi:hypothetical protein